MRDVEIRSSGISNRITMLLFLAVAALIVGSLAYMLAVPSGSVPLFLVILLLVPAIAMAISDSKYLVPYVLFIWTCSPLLRRFAEWAQDSPQVISVVSIAPALISLTLVLAGSHRSLRVIPPLKQAVLCFSFALILGGTVGLLHNGLASLAEFANYATPMLLMLHFCIRPPDKKERDWVLAMLANLAILVAAYGWFQFLVAPEWDTFWMRHVTMVSLGSPSPGKIRIFSTTNAPGNAAMILVTALVGMLLDKRWRGFLGGAGILLVASALAITFVRSAWIVLVVSLLAYILMTPGKKRWSAALGMVVLAVALYGLIPYLPGSKAILARAATLGNLEEDHSFNVRVAFQSKLLPKLVSEPLGRGIGSMGAATKLSNEGKLSEESIVDNGYLAIFLTFGLLGGLLFFLGLWMVFRSIRYSMQHFPELKDNGRLALAMMVMAVINLGFGNMMEQLPAVLFWLYVGTAIGAPPQRARETEPEALSSAGRNDRVPRRERIAAPRSSA